MVTRINKTGFTILELAIAMAFMSFLLLSIGFAIIQISNTYQKGVTIKTVNNNGRELVDEFSRTILASKYNNKGGFELVYSQTYGSVEGIEEEVPLHGVFCVGNYSYLWNTGYALNQKDDDGTAPSAENPTNEEDDYSASKAYLVLGDGSDDNKTVVKRDYTLVRVADTSREACKSHEDNKVDNPNRYEITKANENEYVELLSPTEDNSSNPFANKNDLVLYDMVVFEPVYHSGSGHTLYSASFILGTRSGGVDITTSGDFCTDKPDNFKTDFNYCSINKFNFAARATGGLAI